MPDLLVDHSKQAFLIKLFYRVCHGFRFTKRADYFRVNFDHFWSKCHFCGSWGRSENQLEPKTLPPYANLTKLRVSKYMIHTVWLSLKHTYTRFISQTKTHTNTHTLNEDLNYNQAFFFCSIQKRRTTNFFKYTNCQGHESDLKPRLLNLCFLTTFLNTLCIQTTSSEENRGGYFSKLLN